MNKKIIAILSFFILIYLIFSFSTIQQPDVWVDEYVNLLFTSWGVKYFPHGYTKHPVFQIGVFEVILNIMGNTVLGLRLIPILIGAICIPVSYIFTKSIFKKNALLVSFFITLSPLTFFYFRFFRYYSLLFLIITLQNLLFYKYIKEKNTKNLIWYGILTVIACHIHFLALTVVLAQIVYFAVKNYKKIKYLKKMFYTYLIIGIFLLPLFFNIYIEKTGLTTPESERIDLDKINTIEQSDSLSKNIILKAVMVPYAFIFGASVFPWDFIPVLIGLLIFGIFFIWYFFDKTNKEREFVAYMFFIPLAVGLIILTYISPYPVYFVPIRLIFLLMFFFAIVAKQLMKTKYKAVLIIIIALIFLYSNYNFLTSEKENKGFLEWNFLIPYSEFDKKVTEDSLVILGNTIGSHFMYYHLDMDTTNRFKEFRERRAENFDFKFAPWKKQAENPFDEYNYEIPKQNWVVILYADKQGYNDVLLALDAFDEIWFMARSKDLTEDKFEDGLREKILETYTLESVEPYVIETEKTIKFYEFITGKQYEKNQINIYHYVK